MDQVIVSETPSLIIEGYYTTDQAAEYLGLALPTLKYHVYTSKLIKPSKRIGKSLLFTKEELDRFKANRGESSNEQQPNI